MVATDLKELRVYQIAFESAMDIFKLTKQFPSEERFSLTDQVRRASRSVCANIAEAWRKRRYQAAFILKLNDAETEATETQVWLDFAERCGYIESKTHDELFDHYDHICRQISKMIAEAGKWCKKHED